MNHEVSVIQLVKDNVVTGSIDVDNEGLDGRIAFDQDACVS